MNTISQNFVDQFTNNVFMLAQQKGSKLRDTVRNEMQNGETAYYDRIGSTTAVVKAGRHSNTPIIDTPHSRRAVTLVDYEIADLIDKEDKLRMLHDPQSDYTIAFMWALGRSIDDTILSAFGGNAYSGQKGTTAVPLPTTQQYAANAGGSFSNLNVATLTQLKRMFDDADVEDTDRYIACAPSQIESLLGQTQVTSADYNTVKALVQGEVDSYMGFQFKKMTRVPAQASALNFDPTTGLYVSSGGSSVQGFRSVFAYCKTGTLLAVGQDPVGKVDPRPDKSYAMQVYASMSVGATRLEEVKVIQCFCKEN